MAAPVVEVPLMGTGDAVPEAAGEIPFEATLVAEAPAWATVVHFLSFPRPEQVTFGSLAVHAEAFAEETLHEPEPEALAAAAAAAGAGPEGL